MTCPIGVPPIQETQCPQTRGQAPYKFCGLAKIVINRAKRFEIQIVRGKFAYTFSGNGEIHEDVRGQYVEIENDGQTGTIKLVEK